MDIVCQKLTNDIDPVLQLLGVLRDTFQFSILSTLLIEIRCLPRLDYGSCSGSQGSQYWVQAVPGPSSRGYAMNPAFSETGAATFSGCSGQFQNVRSAEECAEAARKLDGNVGEVGGAQKNRVG